MQYKTHRLAAELRKTRGAFRIYSNTPRHAAERRELAALYRRQFERRGRRHVRRCGL